MKIRLFATVAAGALALTLNACSGDDTPTVAATPAATSSVVPTTRAPATAPVVTEISESNPYGAGTRSTSSEATEWNTFVADAKERITKKFGPNSIASGDVRIYYLGEGKDQVLTVELKGKAGSVMVYPMGSADPYVYYTLEAGKNPNLATMMGGDENNGVDYASSTTEKKQRSKTAYDLAKRLLDELLPKH